MAYISFQPKDHFNTKLYTGTGSSQVLTGVGFQPDFIWTKTRNEAEIHCLNTTVQGINNYLRSNDVDTLETSGSNITAQSSDGYTVGTEDRFNQSSNTFVSWNWKANGQGSSNTDGSINTTYTSVNTTSGFSISTWTGNSTAGATIGHGLGVKPSLIIIKNLGASSQWLTWFDSFANTEMVYLNLTNAKGTGQTYFNSTTPTSSLITLGGGVDENRNTMVAYCFAEKQGYSKFGSYVGNGNVNGPFVYTGFKPAFIITRNITSAVNWGMFDNKRNPFNVVQNVLLPDNSAAETATSAKYFDFLSNGFKVKNDSVQYNGNGEKHIYIAFAEAPLVGSNNVPATAR